MLTNMGIVLKDHYFEIIRIFRCIVFLYIDFGIIVKNSYTSKINISIKSYNCPHILISELCITLKRSTVTLFSLFILTVIYIFKF